MLDLGAFILRAQVLGLYRQGLRAARQAPGSARGKLNVRVAALRSCKLSKFQCPDT